MWGFPQRGLWDALRNGYCTINTYIVHNPRGVIRNRRAKAGNWYLNVGAHVRVGGA
jgi:hypothetical protein